MRTVLITGVLLVRPAAAVDFTALTIESLQSGSIAVTGIQTEIDFVSANEFSMRISATSLMHPDYGTATGLEIHCPVAVLKKNIVHCRKASLHARHEQLGMITGTANIRYGPGHALEGSVHLSADGLPVAALASLAQPVVPHLQDYEVSSGKINISVDMDFSENQLQGLQSHLVLEQATIEGNNVMQDVDLEWQLQAQRQVQDWHFVSRMLIPDGVMYIIPGFELFGDTPGFYLDATDHDLSITATGRVDSGFNSLSLTEFEYLHQDRLQINGSAVLDPVDIKNIGTLSLQISVNNLADVYPVYIEPLLLATEFGDLELAGTLQLGLDYHDGDLEKLSLLLHDVYLDDDDQRFSVSGLNSDLRLGSAQTQRVSSLAWQSLSLYKLVFGAGDITLLTGENRIEVVDWRDVDVLDGTLLIYQLSLSDIGREDFKFTLHGELTPISLKTFTQTMDWPLLSGRLSGSIDGLEYHRGDVRFNGDLKFRVFDGEVVMDGLVIDDLFGRTSRLFTNVDIYNLDLEQVTDTYSFGRIQGSLGGYFRDLTLVNWRPVYFDAVLKNPEDDDRPHRISQKALANLSEIGGGISGSLSSGFIRFIPEYSYGRLGIRCLLSNGVCNLGGVEETRDGFYIMTRGGLLPPWVDVRGTGRSIIWEDLIGGLKQIAEGEVKIE